jgi:hypothetical protein
MIIINLEHFYHTFIAHEIYGSKGDGNLYQNKKPLA